MDQGSYRFGPRLEVGGVRFRLWAPGASEVRVVVEPGGKLERVVELQADRSGWHEALVADTGPGTRYLFDIGTMRVPDPASRFQPDDVLGPSEVVDTRAFSFASPWRGRPWHETVLYELHVGTFAPTGDFAGVERHLDHLRDLGVTAVELMPVSDFAGSRNWGYDGVLPFAPDSSYGRPEDLVRLVDAAHARGLMVFLDVVYNHFGPEGNFLGAYAPEFFTDDWHTPWGQAIDFRRAEVRRYFIENVLYWLDTYHFDGLRLDAVHAISDPSEPHILTEIAALVRAELGSERHVHLVLENDANEARRLARGRDGTTVRYDAQWNDDFHHVAHHLMTGESEAYYEDFATDPIGKLVRSLTQGFIFQGEPSSFRNGELRGEPSAHLPPLAFVNFVQNHDQIGNRAFGERLTALTGDRQRATFAAILLLAPMPPLLFMGEEWAAAGPFLFFTDFHDALADAVRDGRRREFERFAAFADPSARERIPDPNARNTFDRSRLDWSEPATERCRRWLDRHRSLLALRASEVVPLAQHLGCANARRHGDTAFEIAWSTAAGHTLTLLANVGANPQQVADGERGRLLHCSDAAFGAASGGSFEVPGWTALWWRGDSQP